MKSGMNANLGTAQKPLLCFVFFLAHPSPHQGEGTEEVAPPRATRWMSISVRSSGPILPQWRGGIYKVRNARNS